MYVYLAMLIYGVRRQGAEAVAIMAVPSEVILIHTYKYVCMYECMDTSTYISMYCTFMYERGRDALRGNRLWP